MKILKIDKAIRVADDVLLLSQKMHGFDKLTSNPIHKTLIDLAKLASSICYGKANSLLILAIEESVKAGMLISREFDPTHDEKNFIKYFSDHKFKHDSIKNIDRIGKLFSKMLEVSVKPAEEAYSEKGELLSNIAGDKEEVDRISELFDCYCKEYNYLGESGNAHLVKLANNFTGLMYALLLAQIFPLMEKMGFDKKKLFDNMNNELFSNWVYRFYGPKIIDKNYRIDFTLELGLKDLTYVKKLYEEFNVPAFALDGGLDLLRTAIKDGKGKLDFSQCAATMYEYFNI